MCRSGRPRWFIKYRGVERIAIGAALSVCLGMSVHVVFGNVIAITAVAGDMTCHSGSLSITN
jgi:hypothetical protein